ncbi:MAG: nitroreductase family protein [Candidatus Limnocylindrales bacterium]
MGQGPAFFDVVLRQRACRDFASDPVPDDDVARMLEAAVHAPSAENAQPWVFVVVRDADRRRRITELTRRLWDGGAGDHSRPRLAAGLFAEVDGAFRSGFGGAPVLVVVAGDGRDPTTRATLGASVFPAVQNLLLAATALGYGSALTTLPTVAAAELRDVVGLPEGLEPMAVVPIGLPARSLGRPRRQPPAAKTHLDRYEA